MVPRRISFSVVTLLVGLGGVVISTGLFVAMQAQSLHAREQALKDSQDALSRRADAAAAKMDETIARLEAAREKMTEATQALERAMDERPLAAVRVEPPVPKKLTEKPKSAVSEPLFSWHEVTDARGTSSPGPK